MIRAVLAGVVAVVMAAPAAAQPTAEVRAERERFLATARVVATRPVSTGITGTLRVTLDDGSRRHDASVQRIDETKTSFRAAGGKREFGFRDTWKFNLAAYHVALLVGIETVPATVERSHDGDPASYTWWVDDVIMDEGSRQEKQAQAPDLRRWEHQLATMRVFDALIANTDRNKGNLLIDKDWTAWFIDHSRAFRRSREILNPTPLVRCDRRLLAALKGLDEASLKARTARWLTGDEIRALLARRDAIVARLESMPAALYTYTP
ncbi:MAG: hypothetical protein AB7U83_09675 [Vicinamibacterales bacterium]